MPTNSTDVCAFLGLVQYIAIFLPVLADLHIHILTSLTTKDAKSNFTWTKHHRNIFDHSNSNKNIFVTCDASDWHTGTCLSFGNSWETTWPVAYNSMQLSEAEKYYPIHKKELLAIVRALKKWWVDLLGAKFTMYTDHWTLENFNTQHNLSRCQLCWQEFMSQYEMKIVYIKGEDNCVADALSHLPKNCFQDEHPNTPAPHEHWKWPIGTVLSIKTDWSVPASIKAGYNSDPFCVHLAKNDIPGAQFINGL